MNSETPRSNGLLHLYTGTGKGKSTAAAGLALRMAGHGFRVMYVQFLKSAPSGEMTALERFADRVEIRRPIMRHKAFLWNQTPEERLETAEDIRLGWKELCGFLEDDSYRLYVFDELLDVLDMEIVKTEELLEALSRRHTLAEVVLTGRKAAPALLEAADYHTEMTLYKHPYQRGLQARRGVEW